MLRHIKTAAYRAISLHRDSPVVRFAQRAARFVDGAYHNDGNDFEMNGELRVLDLLAPLDFSMALDVGANSGAWSRHAAARWRHCRIHAFEIAPETARRFDDSTAGCADRHRISLHQVGLSDRHGMVPMYFFPKSDDLTCSMPRHPGLDRVGFEGKLTTVDSFSEANGIDRINYLKIDVEGDEFKVIKGAARMIDAGNIDCIQFEYGAFSIDTRFLLKDYHDLIGEKYLIGKLFSRYVLFADYSWQHEDFRFCNYVCVLKERSDIIRRLGRQ